MSKKPINLTNDFVNVGLFGAGGAVYVSSLMSQQMLVGKLPALQASMLDGITVASVLGVSYGILKMVNYDQSPEFANEKPNWKNKIFGAGVLGLMALTFADFTYPHRTNEEFARTLPLRHPSHVILTTQNNGSILSETAEQKYCSEFTKEFAHKSSQFNGDDALGGEIFEYKDSYVRVNCRAYIEQNEHKYPKPDK
jgi:hypothetical protein